MLVTFIIHKKIADSYLISCNRNFVCLSNEYKTTSNILRRPLRSVGTEASKPIEHVALPTVEDEKFAAYLIK